MRTCRVMNGCIETNKDSFFKLIGLHGAELLHSAVSNKEQEQKLDKGWSRVMYVHKLL